MMKKIVILGSTGSIGKSALSIIDMMNEKVKVLGLSANEDVSVLKKQAMKYRPEYVCIGNVEKAKELKGLKNTKILTGPDGLIKLSSLKKADIILIAIVGAAGLLPLLSAIRSGKKIALANKESLVIAGDIVNRERKKYNSRIIPVDSEHSAIFQILQDKDINSVSKIIITASGGPFKDFPKNKFNGITINQALAHPTWKMGQKITVDSATLMNKGLEVIEAHFLFDMPYDKIEVVIHPQSIIHSMVEFTDGSVFAQMSQPDMRLPITYAITYPERTMKRINMLDLSKTGHFDFYKPDLKKFPAFSLALKAGRTGGTMPACMNAANEIAVRNFLDKKIKFNQIAYYVGKVMKMYKPVFNPDIYDIINVDNSVRKITQEIIDVDKNK
ncbi:MAG: 1-deoxy-D-xylulose-5-phosphate reductoisomerase [Candidatus Goldbacteria bacterium]|nr:1-deoxy-D-xylulose-5-phosphate reductoisomerase [Candidatus Goldiibacteriota bacterium]